MALTRKIENTLCSIAVLLPVGLVSMGYVLFKRDFAKLHLGFSFLNFPVFVGEILLFYCALLLMMWWIRNPPMWNRFYLFAVVYLVWFTIKVVIGYWVWGPLALRHAALFYYPFFFMIGYIFFNRQVLTKWPSLGLFCAIEGIFLWQRYDHYWVFTLGCLGLILVLSLKDKKFVIPMALILVFSIPYVYLFKIARMMAVANTASLLLLMAAIFYFLDTKLYIKIIIFILISAGVSLGIYKSFVLGESNRTYTPPGEVIDQFYEMDRIIQNKKASFQMAPLKAALYNPNYEKINVNYNTPIKAAVCNPNHEKINVNDNSPIKSVPYNPHHEKANINYNSLKQYCSKNNYGNMKEQSINNIIFRLLIWRDMWEDWKSQKPLGGFDFGRPLRSPSLEVMHWAETEWGRDGWVEPHNSYFNILYRAGLVGIILVGFIWGALIWFIKLAFQGRSWTLILLAAVFLNWMVAANFLLILELPYTAIPFWTLAGMGFAYAVPLSRSS